MLTIRILACAFFAAFLFTAGYYLYKSYTFYQGPTISALLWHGIPILIVGLLTAQLFRTKQLTRLYHWLLPVCFAGSFIFLLLYWMLIWLFSSSAPVTNPRGYQATMQRVWRDHPIATHFPKTIPTDAAQVRFFAQGKFAMGANRTHLRYATSPERVAELYQTYLAMGSKPRHSEEDINVFPSVKEVADSEQIPPDFECFILKPTADSISGQLRGVAISRQRNEVIYWAEWWSG